MIAKSILILSTNAGSGHSSAARALQDAFIRRYGAAIHVTICNPWQHPAAPRLLRWYERAYVTEVQQSPMLYQLGYALSELALSRHALDFGMHRLQMPLLQQVLEDNPADLVISVYPRLTAAIAASQVQSGQRSRLLTVVTDLADLHRAWFSPSDDYCIVPTAVARQNAITYGIDPRRVRTIGVPVDALFGTSYPDRATLQRALGWQRDCPALLLVGGGAGAGQLAALAHALDAISVPLQLIIVTGTNTALAARLRARRWRIPVRIYDHVPLAPFMHAADIVATKAGGLTISEALAVGKPLLIHSAAPGQEAGNARYIHESGGGQWVSTPAAFVAQVTSWLANPAACAWAGMVGRHLGCPDAADRIAQLSWRLLAARSSEMRMAIAGD
ncbi:MAG: galactosyldiacylglycerol synthase [Roseiflexaceae bacterium]|nr:galactosyldiacylglycerol synthase [Roseiflexaceae bacterium]